MYYIDLQPFGNFMRDRNLEPEKYRSFYIRWIRRLLNSDFAVGELEDRDKVACFSDQLARDSSEKDWQHRQAINALRIMFDEMPRPG